MLQEKQFRVLDQITKALPQHCDLVFQNITPNKLVQWYGEQQYSQYGTRPPLQPLLECLLQEDAFLRDSRLVFEARLLWLPTRAVHALVTVCWHAREALPLPLLSRTLALLQTRFADSVSLKETDSGVRPETTDIEGNNLVEIQRLIANIDQFLKEEQFKEETGDEDLSWLSECLDPDPPAEVSTPTCSQAQDGDRRTQTGRLSLSQRPRRVAFTQVTLSATQNRRLPVQEDSAFEMTQFTQFTCPQLLPLSPGSMARAERLGFAWLHEEGGQTGEEELSVLCTAAADQVSELCSEMGLAHVEEAKVCTIIRDVTSLGNRLPFTNAQAFITTVILPQVQRLESKAGRELLSCLVNLTRQFTNPVLQALVEPCLLSPATGGEVTDLLVKICKEGLEDTDKKCLFRLCCDGDGALTDSAIAILHMAVDSKVPRDDNITTILKALTLSASPHSSNLKFGKLLHSVVNTFAKQMNNQQLAELQRITETQTYFLKKAILSAIRKHMS